MRSPKRVTRCRTRRRTPGAAGCGQGANDWVVVELEVEVEEELSMMSSPEGAHGFASVMTVPSLRVRS